MNVNRLYVCVKWILYLYTQLHPSSSKHSCLYIIDIIHKVLINVLLQSPRNIVSTVTLGCKLDLKDIALRARNAEYNPKVCM